VQDQNKRLYVGNLPYSLRTPDLRQLFESFGVVEDAVVMMEPGDRDRSKGFGFVTMSSAEEAERAALEMNGREVDGRAIVCNVAKPRA
jgi:cold-inducible RNA-binding protein